MPGMNGRRRMHDQRIADAMKAMSSAYEAAFGERPDGVAMMAIKVSASRVLAGDRFEWVEENGFRRCNWKKAD